MSNEVDRVTLYGSVRQPKAVLREGLRYPLGLEAYSSESDSPILITFYSLLFTPHESLHNKTSVAVTLIAGVLDHALLNSF